MEFNYLRHFQRRDLIGLPKSWRREQTPYRALTRPFSLSEAEYAEMGVACETRAGCECRGCTNTQELEMKNKRLMKSQSLVKRNMTLKTVKKDYRLKLSQTYVTDWF